MTINIREKIKELSNEFLLDQYYNKRDEYTPEAIGYMKEEIAERKISVENIKDLKTGTNNKGLTYNSSQKNFNEDFKSFDNKFYRKNLMLVHSIMNENEIPFYIESADLSRTPDSENNTALSYTIYVPESLVEKAGEFVDEHFDKLDGYYSLKYSNIKERLKSFSFHEIDMTGKELDEEIEVQFSSQESSHILTFINRLINEADTIEKESGQVLFYADNLKDCADHLADKNRKAFMGTDLLTILETLQTYCYSENFPHLLDNTIEALLDFFAN